MKKFILLILLCASGFLAFGQEHFYDFIVRGQGSDPTPLHANDDFVLFTASSPTYGAELFVSDGTKQGTKLLKDFSTGGSIFRQFVDFNKHVFFNVFYASAKEIWYTDGTSDGTKLLYKSSTLNGSTHMQMAVFNNSLFFQEQISADSFYIKRVDTMLGKPVIVSRHAHGQQYAKSNLVTTENYLFYAFNDQIYRIDKNFNAPVKYFERSASSAGDIPYLYSHNNTVIWYMRESGSRTMIYAGKESVGSHKEVEKVYGYVYFRDFATVGPFFYYSEAAYNGNPQLQRLNTNTLTQEEVRSSSDPYIGQMCHEMEAYNGNLYFQGFVSSDRELWKTGSSTASTVRVANIASDTSGLPQGMTVAGNKLYFSAYTRDNGRELWVTEGTSANTKMVLDFVKGERSSEMGLKSIAFGNKLVTAAYNDEYGMELWITDGTESGTELLIDIDPSKDYGDQLVSNFMHAGDYMYLFASDSVVGRELWRTDGTAEGTILLDNINIANLPSEMIEHVEFKGDLFGTAFSILDGIELYKSNGSPSGSGFVTPSDIFSSSAPRNYVVEGDYMYFIARRGLFSGDAIFKSDGTKAGTKPYLATGNDIKGIENMRKVGNKILVSITNQNDETYLYWVNTQKDKLFKYSTKASSPIQFFTESDTSMIYVYEDNKTWRLGKNNITETISGQKISHLADAKPDTFFSSGNKEYMIAHTKNNDEIVLAFNETNLIHGVYPKEAYSNVESIISFNSGVIFSAKHATLGQELFIYRDTDTAAVLLSDINPGSASSNPDNFYVFKDKLVFTATTATSGTEVWLTDGTTEGTQLIWDIQPGAGSSFPTEFTSYKGSLYISASASIRQNSLYRMIVDSCDVLNPEIVSTTGRNSFCEGDAITLIGNKGLNDAKLTWLKNGNPTITAGDTLITNEIGSYEIIIKTSKCDVKSPVFDVTEAPALIASAQFESDSMACEGESISLKVIGDDIDKTTWFKNNETYSSNNNTATFGSGSFYAICKNEFGCADTTNLLIATINPNPLPVIQYDVDTLKCTKTFSEYQWYFKGSPVANENNNYIVPDQNGAYKVLVTDSNGCSGESIPFKYEGNSIGELSLSNDLSIFPNPFNDQTQINFLLNKSQAVEISVYNSLGKLVQTLESSQLPSGKYHYTFSAKEGGIFLIEITIDNETELLKVISHK